MPARINRYLETEFEEARMRSDYKRQRKILASQHLQQQQQQPAALGDASSCCGCCGQCLAEVCCSSKTVKCLLSFERSNTLGTMLIYSLFPAFATADFFLGMLAKSQGWYSECVGEMVCHWSASACAIWIAVTLSGLLVATFALTSRCVAAVSAWCSSSSSSSSDEEVGRKRTAELVVV